MIKRFLYFIVFVLFTFLNVDGHNDAEKRVRYSSPVNYENVLAGNFGEPRPNHFHGGVDLKTGGVEGKPIFSIGGGYVSKITIGMFGFGNAVFVQHPEGYTSVYCHLKKFTPQIAAQVRKKQYEQHSAEGEFHFLPSDLPVAEGQLLAVSGNTGASTAPHLHLEIHDTKTWDMLDPLDFIGHHLVDGQPPQGHAIMVYPQEGEGVFAGGTIQQSIGLSSHELPRHYSAWGKVGFGIWANDYMEATYNHYGIRQIEFLVDGRQVFASNVNGIPVNQNMQVNSWGDYDHYLRSHVWYMKAFIEPGVTLPILSADDNRGYVVFDEERDYHLTFLLTDYKGNQSRYSFTVEGKPNELKKKPLFTTLHQIRPDQLNNCQLPGCQLIVRPYMVGKTTAYQPKVKHQPTSYSDAYQFADHSFQLFDYQPIAIRVNKKEVKDPSKLYIVANWGIDKYMGGDYQDGWVWGRARELSAVYELAYDDQPPTIHYQGLVSTRRGETIRLSLTDEKSGVLRYEGYLDDEFLLFEPIAKSSSVECRLKNSSVKRTGKPRTLVFTAEDYRHNKRTFKTQVIY
ncbi:MAG: M23 family metallopeptidase [Prevotella sp.]|nr:M23 family metallopeptidase [Prevotella sp.]